MEKHIVFWRVFHELFGGFYFWVNRSSAVFYRFKCVATVSRIILFFFFFCDDNSVEKGGKLFFFPDPISMPDIYGFDTEY